MGRKGATKKRSTAWGCYPRRALLLRRVEGVDKDRRRCRDWPRRNPVQPAMLLSPVRKTYGVTPPRPQGTAALLLSGMLRRCQHEADVVQFNRFQDGVAVLGIGAHSGVILPRDQFCWKCDNIFPGCKTLGPVFIVYVVDVSLKLNTRKQRSVRAFSTKMDSTKDKWQKSKELM